MGPNASYPVTRWYDTVTDQPVDLITYFQQPGTYTVYVAVDLFVDDATKWPKGYVDEGDLDKGESNNVSQPVTFTVKAVGHVIFVPHVRKP